MNNLYWNQKTRRGLRFSDPFFLLGFSLILGIIISPVQALDETPVRLVTEKAYEELSRGLASSASRLKVEVQILDREQALRTLVAGSADFAIIEDPLTPSENATLGSIPEVKPTVEVLGWEYLSFLVAKDATPTTLTVAEIRSLLQTAPMPSAASGVVASATATRKVILPGVQSWLGARIQEWILGKDKVGAHVIPFSTEAAVERAVSRDRNAIGIVNRLGQLTATTRAAIASTTESEAVLPDYESLKKGTYPYARKILLISQKRHSWDTSAGSFKAYLRTPEAQRLMKQYGFLGLSRSD